MFGVGSQIKVARAGEIQLKTRAIHHQPKSAKRTKENSPAHLWLGTNLIKISKSRTGRQRFEVSEYYVERF
jgi:hypothetical protein